MDLTDAVVNSRIASRNEKGCIKKGNFIGKDEISVFPLNNL
jgi:hypothetical protein